MAAENTKKLNISPVCNDETRFLVLLLKDPWDFFFDENKIFEKNKNERRLFFKNAFGSKVYEPVEARKLEE